MPLLLIADGVVMKTFKTPKIPVGIRRLESPPDLVNPFQIGVRGPNLFGTETLCGDWDGDLLLLGQDFAPAKEVQCVVQKHSAEAAWRHNDGDGRYKAGGDTNPEICRLLGAIGRNVDIRGADSQSCGVLFGNACFFLELGNRHRSVFISGISASERVLSFVLAKMHNLKAIGCLGQLTFEGTTANLGAPKRWQQFKYARGFAQIGKWSVFALAHPGYWGQLGRAKSCDGDVEKATEGDWRRMARAL